MIKFGTIEHRGYFGDIRYDNEDECLVCTVRILGGEHLTAAADSVSELKEKIEDLIDWYLEDCKESGSEPMKQATGTFQVRLKPSLHARLSTIAGSRGVSVNRLVSDVLEKNAARI